MQNLTARAAGLTALAFAAAFALGGCVPHIELNEKAIVEAIGIDYEEERYKVSVQYFNTEGSGGNTLVDTSKPNAITVYGWGETVAAALENASLNCGKPLMFGINQILLIGRDATEKNLSELLSFAKTYYQCHPKIKITAVDGKASEVLEIKFKEGASSPLKLSFTMRNSIMQGIMFDSSLIATMRDLMEETGSAVLPLVRITEGVSTASEDGKGVITDGAVLYVGGRAAGIISAGEVSGLMLLDDEIQEVKVNLPFGEGYVSLTLYDVRTRIAPTLTADGVVFAVRTTAAAQITDNQFGGKETERYELIRQAAAEVVSNTMRLAAENVIRKYGADPINLGTELRSRDNAAWLSVSNRWGELLSGSGWSFETEVGIERYGIYME